MFSISHRFYVQGASIDNVFFWINPVEKYVYTIVSAVKRQQRKSDVMTSIGHSAQNAVCYKASSPLYGVRTHRDPLQEKGCMVPVHYMYTHLLHIIENPQDANVIASNDRVMTL
jgi:hypothetical protein